MIFLNIIVLVLEILYYSIFMYYAKGEGKFWRYLLLFSSITFIGCIIGTNYLFSYLILVLMMLYGIKYIVKVKTSLYDMLIIIIMLVFKAVIEIPIYVIFLNNIKNLHFIATIIPSFLKISIILLARKRLVYIFYKLKILWNRNNFYIRYIFSISTYIYVIITIILLIKLLWEV